MKLWFDEDLSPTLVHVANDKGFEATCNRDRGVLGLKDPALRTLVQDEGAVFVTDNASDFRPMYARDHIHPGLIVLPGAHGRDVQQRLLSIAIDWIVNAATAAGESPEDYLVNTLVDVGDDGACTAQALPDA